jgi:secondary thiamine-phosphate synthase enzyme
MTKPALIQVRSTKRIEITDISEGVASAIRDSGVAEGICVLQSLHTTAALTINESADPDVRLDLERQLALLAPRDPSFRHAEGNSDAHIKTSLFGPSLSLVVSGGRPLLGTWQAIYFCEFDGPRERRIVVKVLEG